MSNSQTDYVSKEEQQLRERAVRLKLQDPCYFGLELDEIFSVLMMPCKMRRQWERQQRKNRAKVAKLEREARSLDAEILHGLAEEGGKAVDRIVVESGAVFEED